MKKLIVTLVSFSCAFALLISPVHAKETTSITDVQGSFEMIIEENASTRATFTGPGGTATLNYAESGKIVRWSYATSTGEVIVFSGVVTISLASSGQVKKQYMASGGGSSCSGQFYLGNAGLRKNTMYKATFTGTGVALSGNKYYIKSGAYINFMYK